jgi:CubicO group peptidase (beta-lactamase class C family)
VHSPERIAAALLADGVDGGVFSGAQAAWRAGPDRRLELASAGVTRITGGAPVDRDTLFDVASLTKLFTAAAALRLAERGELALGATLVERLPELRGTPQARATLEQVLAHEAGFTPWAPLFEAVPGGLRGTPSGRAALLAALAGCAPASSPDGVARYSDLGYIALAVWMERVVGGSLEEIIAAEVTAPLGLSSARFRPSPAAVAVTSTRSPHRGELAGEVHDDNAWAAGGVAGHAGLFAAARDVARLGAAWLDALGGAGSWLSRDAAEAAVRRRPSGRGLGFDFVCGEGSSAGALMARDGFGHLGFTGCSLWIDRGRGCAIALSTNRVLMGEDLAAIKAFRPRFHDGMMRALYDPRPA